MFKSLLKSVAAALSRIYPSDESTTSVIRSIAVQIEAKTGENPLADLTEGTLKSFDIILAVSRIRDAYDSLSEADHQLESMIRQLEDHYAEELSRFQ